MSTLDSQVLSEGSSHAGVGGMREMEGLMALCRAHATAYLEAQVVHSYDFVVPGRTIRPENPNEGP